jgi:hypothetical protein
VCEENDRSNRAVAAALAAVIIAASATAAAAARSLVHTCTGVTLICKTIVFFSPSFPFSGGYPGDPRQAGGPRFLARGLAVHTKS